MCQSTRRVSLHKHYLKSKVHNIFFFFLFTGIRTPAVYAVNSPKNQIIMEFIKGKTVKDILLILEESVKENNIPQCDESEMIVDDNDDSNDDDDNNEPREEKIVKNVS